ncbi:hypothetical protein Pmar_PMAR025671 [Perkinsus marinus ATCC 50983]|uniref:ATP-dependent DNA helicase n=1 Tax=Perkinsus marinus (strain ATCC 50983 / TXsc) TaxID=423536 RepID=C5KIP2_PERM5|nr:hypothetical protein Pmar_PMAR025671 [Perkinsus marinus ATCC 50983]EER15658.1 hypothetical protein Pmar_PMAR025671 [Perkinsus marinus ATCC 50983]|eukprot:XP_002783862.1 hypothetical protein Pmar_PMAR025671 [Perkinsus marinus ATCC 50983]
MEYHKRHGNSDMRAEKIAIVIDEVEAIYASILDGVAYAVGQMRPPAQCGGENSLFGDAVVVLVGDPCQAAGVEPMDNPVLFPTDEFPLLRFWEGESWARTKPVIMYLTGLHRCVHEGYLQLLREIRRAPSIRPGLPSFSEQSLQILQAIRDRDGGRIAPRFSHTVICLTNAEVDRHNKQILQSIPGVKYEIECIQNYDSLSSSFDFAAVAKLGYKEKIVLKKGCRVMATANSYHRHPASRFSNGAMGTVLSIYNDELGQPTVVVDFDDDREAVHIKRQSLVVRGPTGKMVFERRQIPLTPCYAMTAHRVLGATLEGVWAILSSITTGWTCASDDAIANFWQAPWLQGLTYTVMSRVSSPEAIRMLPIRNTVDIHKVLPIFSMDRTALTFDAKCAEESWLTNSPLPRLLVGSRGPEENDQADTKQQSSPTGSTNALESLEHKLSYIEEKIKAFEIRMLVSQHYATRQNSTVGDPVNPVLYCMRRPSLSGRLENMSLEAQLRFFELLHERLNLTFPRPSQEAVEKLIENISNEITEGSPVPMDDSETLEYRNS